LASSSHRSRDDGREGPAIQDQEEVAMFGFMLDETDGADSKALATCRTCHIRLASRAARVVDGEHTFHRDCYEAAHKKRTGKRPSLVTHNGDRMTFRLAA
jgi:hypothetical protein